jgi:hypothetical protein
VVGDFFVDIFLLDKIFNVDLFGLLKLVLLFFLDIFLHNSVYLSRGHVFFYLLGQLVENALVLDRYPQKSLLELLVRQPYRIVLVILLVLREMPEYLRHLVGVNYQRVQLEHQPEVLPSLKNNLVVILLESNRGVARLQQEVKHSPDRRLEF